MGTIHSMETLVANIGKGVRRVTQGGKSYLIAPASLIVPGVLNGSNGPLYYPPEEVAKSTPLWEDIPLTNGHPLDDNGNPISARTPAALLKYGVGVIRKPIYNNTKLTAEAWVDIDAASTKEPKIVTNLNSGKPLESSTGLFTENELATAGAKDPKGRRYTHIAKNYIPDHFAILANGIGACSIKDGCGIGVVVNADGSLDLLDPISTDNELSHSDIRMELQREIDKTLFQSDPSAWITDVFDDSFIYRVGSNLFRRGYKKEGDNISLIGEPERVKAVVSFVSANEGGEMSDDEVAEAVLNALPDMTPDKACKILEDGTANGKALTAAQKRMFGAICGRRNSPTGNTQQTTNGDTVMAKFTPEQKKQIVDRLVANCNCHATVPWKGKDSNALNALSEDLLESYDQWNNSLAENQEKGITNADGSRSVFDKATNQWKHIPAQTPNPQTQNTVTPSQTTQQVPTIPPTQPVITNGQQVTLSQMLNHMSPYEREVWETAVAVHNREKTDLIGRMVANHSGQAREQLVQFLNTKPLPELQMMANLLPPPPQQIAFPNNGFVPGYGQPSYPIPTMPQQNYAGMGAPAYQGNSAQTTEEPLVAPTYNFADKR